MGPFPYAGEVLVVDDDEQIRALLAHVLESGGHSCTLAAAAEEARSLLRDRVFDLLLCDIQMPGGSGIDLIRHVARAHPETATMMVTGLDDPELAQVALELGAYGYLIKPFRSSELLINVANALRRRRLELESRRYQSKLEQAVLERTAELRRSREETINRLARAVEFRDSETGLHIAQMAQYCELLARGLGLDDERCELIRVASPLHDVGKIGVPDGILLKPGRLTAEERRIMERHTEIGYRVLAGSGSDLLELAATIALTHHERVDGTGYPRRLVGREIPLEGRIAAVADVFAALTSERRYRSALSPEEAFEVLRAGRGSQFDEAVFDVLVELEDEVRAIHSLGEVGELTARLA